jgi:hypothetical protein
MAGTARCAAASQNAPTSMAKQIGISGLYTPPLQRRRPQLATAMPLLAWLPVYCCLLLLLLLLHGPPTITALENGVGQTPPMGWMAYVPSSAPVVCAR